MGMFDTVVIEGLKLPTLTKEVNSYLKKVGKSLPNDFQTKDLDNSLSTYTIDSKGQIYLTEYKPTGKKIPYESPFANWTDNRSFIERMYFKLQHRHLNKKYSLPRFTEERKPVKVKTKITNTFEVYNYEQIDGRYVDVSFIITAIDGKVTKISLNKAEIESEKEARERIKRNEEFDVRMALNIDRQRKFRSQWYYPILKETYNPILFLSSKLVQAACNWLIKQTYRWRGV